MWQWRSIPCAILEPRLEALAAHLPDAVTGNAAAVHQARVASRRLREVLPVFGAPAGLRRLRRTADHVRRVTRALGPVRELDVSLELLNDLVERHPGLATAVKPVRALVMASRERRRQVLVATLNASTVARTVESAIAVLDRLARTPDLGDWRAPLLARIAGRADALVDAVNAVGLLFDPSRLHLVRIAAKKLRYSLEVASDARVAATRPLIEVLKQSQEQLGRLHDLQVLLVFVRQADIESGSRREPGLGQLRDVMERECLREHARYLRRRSRILEACASASQLATRVPTAPSSSRAPRGRVGPVEVKPPRSAPTRRAPARLPGRTS